MTVRKITGYGARNFRAFNQVGDTPNAPLTPGFGQILPLRKVAAAQFARPADTTAYTAGDVISTLAGLVLTFPLVSDIPADYVYLEAVKMFMSSAVATGLISELNLFSVAPAAIADNAAWAPSDAEMLNWVGAVPLVAADGYAGTLNRNFIKSGLAMPIKLAAAATSLFGVLVARNAYVPTSAETFDINIHLRAATGY